MRKLSSETRRNAYVVRYEFTQKGNIMTITISYTRLLKTTLAATPVNRRRHVSERRETRAIRFYIRWILSRAFESEGSVPQTQNLANVRTWLLCGAGSWQQYSVGGCALVYTGDLKKRLLTGAAVKQQYRAAELCEEEGRFLMNRQAALLAAACARVCDAYASLL